MTTVTHTQSTLARLPVFILMMGIGGGAMIVPSAHALAREDFATARIFFYGALLTLMLASVVAIAMGDQRRSATRRSQLLALFAAFAVLPLVFAAPLYHAAPARFDYLDAWFEMVSSFTTTGATVYDGAGGRLNSSLHLWRALVGWMGGFLVWIMAMAILAPMNLGGFEVRALPAAGRDSAARRFVQITQIALPAERLIRFGADLLPVYAGLTGLLWVGLLIAGEVPIAAITHAMAILSTSGISAVGGVHFGASGVFGEILMFAFLIFAVSRTTFARNFYPGERRGLMRDPEAQMALALVAIVPTLLFLRHFVGAFESPVEGDIRAAMAALWGAIFTCLSFLTTTGFESADWLDARDWSGLETPGLILVGLALVGGGVATTAGGVKLLRVYALWKHGLRELERLVHPNSVGGAGAEARRIRKEGAYIAWLFFMLFALSIAATMLLLALAGVQFETAMVLAVAALSTTGPLADVAAENPIAYSGIPDAGKIVLAAAMVLGRMETLALIALFNAETWRS